MMPGAYAMLSACVCDGQQLERRNIPASDSCLYLLGAWKTIEQLSDLMQPLNAGIVYVAA